jgi:Acetyl-coenzyme A transporter 1
MKRRKQQLQQLLLKPSMDSLDVGSAQGFFRARPLSHIESQSLVAGGAWGDHDDPSSILGGVPAVANDTTADENNNDRNDLFNYALLIVLYALQGIPMGLSASIPFLIQQKVQGALAAAAAAAAAAAGTAGSVGESHHHHTSASSLAYNANAIFALCSWPFSLKLLWAPIVDACYLRRFGRRKSWLVPVQLLAGLLMVAGSTFVEQQLGISSSSTATGGAAANAVNSSMNVTGLTAFFFALYFLMATQDIAVDGWALTMLSKKNRGRGPVCNSIGQNIGYFISFVGFLALNDAEACDTLWRPLLRLPRQPGRGLVSLGGFLRAMGYFMLATTTFVAVFKREVRVNNNASSINGKKVDREDYTTGRIESQKRVDYNDNDDDGEIHDLDASELGLQETYHRLWAVCKLPSVQWLFVVLLTYRLPTSLTDNVKVRVIRSPFWFFLYP